MCLLLKWCLETSGSQCSQTSPFSAQSNFSPALLQDNLNPGGHIPSSDSVLLAENWPTNCLPKWLRKVCEVLATYLMCYLSTYFDLASGNIKNYIWLIPFCEGNLGLCILMGLFTTALLVLTFWFLLLPPIRSHAMRLNVC